MSDAINPDHYKRLPAEAIEIIEAMIAGAPDNKAAYLHGQAAKYDLRLWEKGKSLEDYLTDWRKHIWYALRLESHLLELIEKQKADEQQKAADLQSLKDHPFGKLKTPSLNSDTIPEGHRKLGDSLIEPRQVGDLRWSIIEEGYIEISVDEIVCANRDNWAACRKVESVVKQSLTTEPPDGWRWLEVGEKLRRGDTTNTIDEIPEDWIGIQCAVKHNLLRRNRFEVGEKVVDFCGQVWEVEYIFDTGNRYRLKHKEVRDEGYGNNLAPYIEVTVEVTPEVTGEVKPPIGWRFLEVGEVIRKGDRFWYEGAWHDRHEDLIGCKYSVHHCQTIRRNRFEVGEKVKHGFGDRQSISVVENILWDGWVDLVRDGVVTAYHVNHLAPYVEEAN